MRIFCSRSSSAQMICAAVDRQVRDRLLSIKASPQVQPSLLQCCFSCTRPP
ncbi:hypothetical protein YC2023_110702 [Brassica napus]